MAAIIEQTRAACLFLWRRFHKRIFVYGHSAGAHLAACLLATDWKTLAPDAPADLVPAVHAASGMFDMTPLLRTRQYGDPASSMRHPPARFRRCTGACRLAACSTSSWARSKSSEFLRQSRTVARAWRQGMVQTRYEEIAGANHFTIVDPLARCR